jgi:L-threonylcarbamoyladenylate synthase
MLYFDAEAQREREAVRCLGVSLATPHSRRSRVLSGLMPMQARIIYAGNESAQCRAVEVLRGGGLVAFPTDTVYGLAMLPWDSDAVLRLYEVKRRPSDRPIPLLLSDAGQLSRVAKLQPCFRHLSRQLVTRFWPGGLTLVLPKAEIVPDAVSAGPTVAVRVPDLPLARDIICGAGGVLAVTSANLSGQPNPITAQEVEDQLGDRIDLILDGGSCRAGVPSTILDCTVSPPRLLRRGAVSAAALRATIGPIAISN